MHSKAFWAGHRMVWGLVLHIGRAPVYTAAFSTAADYCRRQDHRQRAAGKLLLGPAF